MYIPVKRGQATVQKLPALPKSQTSQSQNLNSSRGAFKNVSTEIPEQHRGGPQGQRQSIESYFLKLSNETNSLTQPLINVTLGNVFPNQKKRTIRVEQAYFYYQATSLNELPVSFAISATGVSGLKINVGNGILNTNLIAFLQPISIQQIISQATGQAYYNVMYATKIPFIWQVGTLASTSFRFWAETQAPHPQPAPVDNDIVPTYVEWPLTLCPLSFKFDIVHQK